MNEHQPATLPPHSRPKRIAFAHDWLVGYRGGEAVLERIIEVSGRFAQPAGLYTMFDECRPLAPAIDALRRDGLVRTSSLTALPRIRRWLLPLYPMAVSQLGARLRRDHAEQPIDLLVSTSSAAIHGLRAPKGVPHVCYCHAPARYLWSQTDQYAGGMRGLSLKLLAPALRALDRRASRNVTSFLANSTATAALIGACFGREAAVVYPPVRTDFFTPFASHNERPEEASIPDEPFLLIAGALEPYKRTDLAIALAKRLNKRLVIAGDGSQAPSLRALAADVPTVSFFGPATHEQLRALYRAADVLLYPQIEDFGITAVEAQACGTPVVAVGVGGALDTVQPGVTGAFATDQSVESFTAAIGQCPTKPACSQACRENALRFAAESFDERMAGVIRSAVG
ncbi:MAG: glycosyltransferase [Phycisphaeraceae bacterium]|nr:glycosyltransferase [Phycisphaeraceae bacterium]